MELTSKQRAQLRGMAANLDTIVHVGKDGIGENLIKQVNDALEARELIKEELRWMPISCAARWPRSRG